VITGAWWSTPISGSPRRREAIINGPTEILLASDITLRDLHGCIPKQELNLFQLSSGSVAEPGAAPP